MKKGLATVLLAAGLLLFSSALHATGTFAAEQRYDVPVGDSHALGPPNAPVTLIEFIDYQ
jgi:hypothetical protein